MKTPSPPRSRRCGIAALVLLGLLLHPAVTRAQSPEREIEALATRLDSARSVGLHLVTPGGYESALGWLAEARGRHRRGEPVTRVREALEAGRASIAEAEGLWDRGRGLFEEALEARGRALARGAPGGAPEAWAEAEATLAEGGRRLERGDPDGAATRAALAVSLYRNAVVEAARAEVLGSARAARAGAVEAGAPRWSPETFAEAEERLARASRLLAENPADSAAAVRSAGEAAGAYRRAARVAVAADSVRRGRLSVEAILRRHGEAVARIADALDLEEDPDAPVERTVEEARAAVRSLLEERAGLEARLAERDAELAEARERVRHLEARAAELERREAELEAELRERERREARLRETRALFTPEEGEVLVRGDSLVLRLHGLSFEPGSHEIRTEDAPLLTKLERVLEAFPRARVIVEGHTDSRGEAAANRALSQRRAIAVREHLLARMPISSSRIAAVGHGEERPVAPDDTEEGRARNRRIEVIVDLSDPGG